MTRKGIFSELQKGQFFYYPRKRSAVYLVVYIRKETPIASVWRVGDSVPVAIQDPADFNKQIILTTKPKNI